MKLSLYPHSYDIFYWIMIFFLEFDIIATLQHNALGKTHYDFCIHIKNNDIYWLSMGAYNLWRQIGWILFLRRESRREKKPFIYSKLAYVCIVYTLLRLAKWYDSKL